MSWQHTLLLPRTLLEGREKKADELAECTPPTKDTKAAEEVLSEATKARVADDDSQSTLSRLEKMDNSGRQAVISEVQQAIKVNSKLKKKKLQGPTGEGWPC
jgi:hypothetical protein